MKKKLTASLDNILHLFSLRLEKFEGESRRSYQKAFSSFQLFIIANFPLDRIFTIEVVENWIADAILQGLTKKTVSFYLDKIASLYSGVADKLVGGRILTFKNLKISLKDLDFSQNYPALVNSVATKMRILWNSSHSSGKKSLILESIENFTKSDSGTKKDSISFLWDCLALKAGVRPGIVRSVSPEIPPQLNFLSLCKVSQVSDSEKKEASLAVHNILSGDNPQWFALRLRPRVKYDDLIDRFSRISQEVKLPELFYPSEEIAKRVGHKVVWKGKPIIRDVVFFRSRKVDVTHLLTRLYDLAWCYRTPGGLPGQYASIPDKAMLDFKKALGMLTPDFEVAPAGEMELKPGDKVIVVNEKNMEEPGLILKKASLDNDGNKIYRVSLLNRNGHWDIGIDARLIRKQNDGES